jgi:uncharacterized protein (DUF927 family)
MAVLGFTGRGNNKTYNASYDEIYSSVREFLEKDDYQFIEDNFYKDYPNLINDERVTAAVKSILRSKKLEKLNNDFSDENSNYVNDKICESWSEYLAPFGYFIDHTGVFKEIAVLNKNTKVFDNIRKDVCKTPFILSGVSESPDDNSIFYKVRYASINGTVKELWANQYDLLSKRELKKLFNSNGINCPENSILNETISYISQSIAEFGSKLKKEISTKQNGWQDNRFIWGNRAITKDRIEPILALQKFPELCSKGDMNSWADGVKIFLAYDVARFRFYDAMSAPLKNRLNCESHCTDHHGNTSAGKTLLASAALSMIGDPSKLMMGAKGTGKGILVRVRDYSDHPVLIDESSDAGEHLSDLVYTLTSGKGRVKSTTGGERDGGELYRTTAMFTGEKPIRDCLPNAGQQYRVIEVNDVIPELPTKEIDRVKRIIANNYGHIIELFIQEIFNNDVQKIYDECFDSLPETKSNIEGRSKSIFACIMTSGILLERVFKKIGISERDPVEIVNKYFKECIQDNPVELEWKRALRIINDWTISEAWKFEDGSKELKYDVVGKITFEYIDIIGTEFTKKMKECGFSPTAIRQALYHNEISVCKSSRQDGNYSVTVNEKTTSGVRIIRKAMAKELQLGEDLPDWYDEYSRKVLETVTFICKMRGSASLQQVQDIVGYTHKLELSVKPFLSELEHIGYITLNENGEYVSNVLENI